MVGALLAMGASAAKAQVPWETPQLLAPHAPRGMGVLAATYAAAPGDGWGMVVAWRGEDAPTGWGFRIAAGRGRGDRDAIGGGLDVSSWIARASARFPLDVIWTSGFGGSYGNSMQLALPIGFAAGRSLGDGSVWFNPYVAARVIMEGRLGGAAVDEELETQLATEIGANMSFDRNRRFIVRTAAAIGDRSALSVGAHIGGGRRNALRASTD